MKQTAVDWLIGQLYAPCRGIPSHIIEQAKEMEKEQIMDAYDAGWSDGVHSIDLNDEYYYETFNING
jgi:hypothetical protein